MSRTQSIESMRLGLTEAISHSEWPRALRYIDRLKGIIIDGIIQDDPVAIRLVGNVLQHSGERLELLADLPMSFDQTALAWQLRADAGTAALAARVRPVQLEPEGTDREASDLRTHMLQLLNRANAPISNSAFAARTGKDPAVISRALKQLERKGLVRGWRGPNGQRLNALQAGQLESTERLNRLRIATPAGEGAEVRKQAAVQPLASWRIRGKSQNLLDGKVALPTRVVGN